MKRFIFSVILLFVMISKSHAISIYESATGPFDSIVCCATRLNTDTFIVARFSLGKTTSIDHIGGHFFDTPDNDGAIFGAIVGLTSSGLPSDNALTLDNVLASTIFTPETGRDFLTPLSTTLDAGTYGLAFGSGLFGTSGRQYFTLLQPSEVLTSSGDMVGSSSSAWFEFGSLNRHRLIISGGDAPAPAPAPVPEPGTLILMGSGLACLFVFRKRLRKQA